VGDQAAERWALSGQRCLLLPAEDWQARAEAKRKLRLRDLRGPMDVRPDPIRALGGRTRVRFDRTRELRGRILVRAVDPGLRLPHAVIPPPRAAAIVPFMGARADRHAVPGVPGLADGTREAILSSRSYSVR
jgi:hypothetical protein